MQEEECQLEEELVWLLRREWVAYHHREWLQDLCRTLDRLQWVHHLVCQEDLLQVSQLDLRLDFPLDPRLDFLELRRELLASDLLRQGKCNCDGNNESRIGCATLTLTSNDESFVTLADMECHHASDLFHRINRSPRPLQNSFIHPRQVRPSVCVMVNRVLVQCTCVLACQRG